MAIVRERLARAPAELSVDGTEQSSGLAGVGPQELSLSVAQVSAGTDVAGIVSATMSA